MTTPLNQGLELFLCRLDNFEQLLRLRGIHVRRACLYRSARAQASLYLQGRSTPGNIVTNARANQSPHNWGNPKSETRRERALAADYVPLIDGHPNYTPGPAWWAAFGHVAKQAHLTWGGSWKAFPDNAHVELPKWQDYVRS